MGVFRPERETVPSLSVGEVGSFWANIKDLHWTRIGDTITETNRPTAEPLPGFAEAKPMVFAGLFPTNADDYANLRDAMDKLRLNDASFTFEPENSTALGFGFRCGFLGLLHMEIVQERLEREFDLDLITTAPGVSYRVTKTDGDRRRDREPESPPRAQLHRADGGALHLLDDHHARRFPRRPPQALRGPARRAEVARVPLLEPRRPDLRVSR